MGDSYRVGDSMILDPIYKPSDWWKYPVVNRQWPWAGELPPGTQATVGQYWTLDSTQPRASTG